MAMENKKQLVKTTCPICGGAVAMNISKMPNKDKEELEKMLDGKSTSDIIYKGATWVFKQSAGLLAWSHGMPYSFGKEAASIFTDFTDSLMKENKEELRESLSQIPDIYLFEFKCKQCGFVLNRYYTRK